MAHLSDKHYRAHEKRAAYERMRLHRYDDIPTDSDERAGYIYRHKRDRIKLHREKSCQEEEFMNSSDIFDFLESILNSKNDENPEKSEIKNALIVEKVKTRIDPQEYRILTSARVKKRQSDLRKEKHHSIAEEKMKAKRNSIIGKQAASEAESRIIERVTKGVKKEFGQIRELIEKQEKSLNAMNINRLLSPRFLKPIQKSIDSKMEKRLGSILDTPTVGFL